MASDARVRPGRSARGAPIIHRWSTSDVVPTRRLNYYTAATSAALIPIRVRCDTPDFNASVERAELGPLDLLRMHGSAHDVLRNATEIARSRTHHFYLMLNIGARWHVTHRHSESLASGEAMLIDSDQPFELNLRAYKIVALVLPATWIGRRVRHPERLAGRCLSRDSAAGRALADMMMQLTPRFAIDPPIPGDVIAEQIGALLSMACTDAGRTHSRQPWHPEQEKLPARIRELMGIRRGERTLDEVEVARALGVKVTDVSDAFSAQGETFEDVLNSLRVGLAARMLRSTSFAAVADADIARRAGFQDLEEMAVALLKKLRGRL